MLTRCGALVLCTALCLWVGIPLRAWADDTGLKVATAIAAAGGSWSGTCTVANLNASENNRASTGTNNDFCVPSTFAFGVPAGATINGIEVRVEGSNSVTNTVNYSVQLSWDAGTSWTTPKANTFTSTNDATDTLGGAADTWGRTWSASEFSDTNFRLRIYRTGGTGTLRVDMIQVRVTYSPVILTQIHTRWRNDDGGESISGSWYDASWNKRKAITIDNTGNSNTLTNYQVQITVTYDADMQADFDDLRFTNASGTELDYWRYSKTDSVSAIFWVEVDSIAASSNTTIYMYYGNASVSTTSNAKNTMFIYENMDSTPTGTLKGSAYYDATNDWVRLTTTAAGPGQLEYSSSPTPGYVAEWRFWTGGGTGADACWMYAQTSSTPAYEDSPTNGYSFTADEWDDQIQVYYNNNTNKLSYWGTTTIDNSTWHTVRIVFYQSGGTYYYQYWYDGTQRISSSSANAPSGSLFGWGARIGGSTNEHRIDDLVVRKYTSPDPTVSTGSEEDKPTAATWATAEDVKLPLAIPGTIYRARFEVSNEGTGSSGAVAYKLQVAETATCSSGSYADVPTDSSGHWQLADSSYLTDAAATTNVTSGLTDEASSFVAGQVKDTGNTTGGITLAGDQFTELEFAIRATDNSTYGGSYCLRLYNATAGTTLTTYTKYAEVGLAQCQFDFRKALTVQSGQVSNGPHTDFPMLVSLTDTALRSRPNGGRLYSGSGYDIIFRALDDTTCGGAGTAPCTLDHEIEQYTATTGQLVAWVRVPSINTGTVIYLYYGNSCITSATTNPAGVWNSSFKGVWHFTGNLLDSTSNDNDGTNSGTTSGTGQFADARSFNGSSYISVAHDASLNITAQLTLEAWVYLTNANNNQKIVGKTYNPAGYGYLLGVQTGSVYPEVWNSANTNYTFTSGTVPSGQWRHLAVTWTQGGNLVGYINGSQVNSIAGGSNPLGTNTNPLIIGAAPWDTSSFRVTGLIDEVRVSSTARSAGWILTEYRNQNAPGSFYSLGSEEGSCANAYLYRKALTVQSGQVSGGPHTDFPMVVNLTNDANLKTTANGGGVTNANGYDIIFKALDDTTCGGAGTAPCTLDHEIEKYDGSTGQLVAWVRVPSINTGTVIYLYYGNSCISSATANPGGVWVNYKGVWHLKESGNGTAGEFKDSTSNANHGTGGGGSSSATPAQVGGQFAYGQEFDGSADFIRVADSDSFNVGTGNMTLSAWVYIHTAGDNAGDYNGIASHTNGTAATDGWWWTRFASDDYTPRAVGVSMNDTDHLGSNNLVTVNGWFHVVAVKSGTTISHYVNGAFDKSVNLSRNINNSSGYLRIGMEGSTYGSNYFDGVIDEVRFAGVARSADWLGTEHNNMSAASSFYSVGAQEVLTGEAAAAPTAVRLRSATATALESGGVLLQWETGWEQGNLGFHVWRVEGSERVRVTPELLAGSALRARGRQTHFTAGHSYRWLDPAGVLGGSYYLEDLDVDKTRTLHGPLEVTLGSAPAPGAGPGPVTLRALGQLRAPHPIRRHAARPAPSAAARRAQHRALLTRPAVKLLVEAEGWVRVSQPALVAAGLDPAVDPRTLQLFAEGTEVPLLLSSATATRFGPEATLEFYGTGLESPWTTTRTYWLTWGAARGARLRSLPASGSGGPLAPASFPATVTRADRVVYVATLLNGEASNFFGPVLSSEPVALPLPVPSPDPAAAESATLTLTLQGLTTEAHAVSVHWNGSPVGSLTWTGSLPATLTVPLPPSSLLPGENTLTLTPAGSEEDVSLLDSVSLTYPRRYVAEAEALRCSGPGGSPLSLAGFSDPRLQALDLTEPSSPLLLSGSVDPQGDGTYALTLRLPGRGSRTLYAWSAAAVRAPAALVPYRPVVLTAADLVILAPTAFHAGLAPLVALREQQGLTVRLLAPQALYDAYSYGAKDPAALQAFLREARQHGPQPPRYLLLVGAASVDPRDYLGTGRADLLPTLPVDTALLETAWDEGYALLDATGLPALAVGRLPVSTEAELTTVVAKLLAYEAVSPSAPWLRQALFLADTAADFDYATATSALAAQLPAPFAAAPLLTERSALLGAWDQGAALLLYLGHGSVSSWSAAPLLESADAPTLANAERLPLVLAFTCFTGFHHDPYTVSLAAALLTAQSGGALAVWASSGMTEPAAQLPLAQAALRSLQPALRLGDWLRAAKAGVALRPDVRSTWTLFGDPSMPVK